MSYCVIMRAPVEWAGAFGARVTMIGRSILGRSRIAAAGSALRAAAAGLGLRAPVAAAGLGLLALMLAALIWLPVVALANSPPATPASVTLSRSGDTLTIVWDTPAGATKYHVTYSSDGGNSWTAAVGPDDNHSAASIDISSIDTTKTYIVAVRAGNDHGWSGWRNSAPNAPDAANVPPATPGTISITRADGTLTASWDAVNGATKYHVTYSSNNGGSWNLAAANHTSASITISVDNQKTYIVAVRAGNDGGWSGWSHSAASGPYGPEPPATPASVAVSRANGTLTASGYGVSGATKYHVTYSADGGKNWNAAPCGNNCTGGSVTISGVDDAKTYIVAVRAGNAGGWSGWRNSPSSGPSQPPAAPSSITVIRVCDSRFEIAWPAVSGATGYDVNFSTNSGKSWKRTLSNVSVLAWKFNQWSKNKTYILAVRARNAAGEGGWTNSAAFPPPPCRPDTISAVTSTTHGTAGGSITTSWNAAKRASAYNVNYRPAGGEWQRIQSGVSATTHTGTVSSRGGYTVAVQSTSGNGMSHWRNAGVSWLTASSIVGSAATLTLTGHSGDWYVKKTAPTPAGTCSSAISGSTHDLTGLDGGTTQTVTAYSDAGCGNAIASTTFTTLNPTLTVSDVTGSGATLNLADYSRNWYVKKTAPAPAGTCSSAITGATHDLTGLTGGTNYYTYTAYSDSGCATALHSVTFATPVTVSNLGETVHANSCLADIVGPCAVGFTTGSAAGGYTLAGITGRFGAKTDANNALGDIVVTLHAAIATTSGDNLTLASTALATLSGVNPDTAGDYTYTCAGAGCALAPSTTYFVRLAAAAGTGWEYYVLRGTESDGQTTEPSGSGWTLADETDHGNNSSIVFPEASLVRVAATVNPRLTVSDVTASGATLTLSNYDVAWWYQGSQSGAACTSAGTAATASLANLPSGTSYTYTAYRDSGCVNALDLVTFATPLTAGNLGETTHTTYRNEVGYKSSGSNRKWANAFTTGSEAAGYTLDEVTFEFGATTGSPTQVHAKIYADASGLPGTLVKNLGSKSAIAAGNQTWSCTGSNCTLAADTTYHVALEADATGTAAGHYYDWKVTSASSQTNAPAGAGWTIADYGSYQINQGSWIAYGDEPGKFQVAATANPSLTATSIGDMTATLMLRNYSGAWWLKRTSPADTTCKAMGTATTANLSSLTVGQAYTYKAYSKSGCASGDELASVTFSAINLTASAVAGGTTATFTIAGYTGNWWVKRSAPTPEGSCSRTIRGATHNLSGLTTGRTYTYKAYDTSGCASADEIASVTFRIAYLSVSNLGVSQGGGFVNIVTSPAATAFTTGSATGGYALQSVTLYVGHRSSIAILGVEVRAASGGKPAAAALTTLRGPNPQFQGQYTYVCSANCALAKDTTYFLVLSVTGNGGHGWATTTSDAETNDPAGNGWAIGNVVKIETYAGSGVWNDHSYSHTGRFRVAAKAGAGLGADNITPTTATLNVSNHSGAWWYQGGQSGANCTSVDSGTTTAALSNLTASTSYTYTAYDAAGCNAADELDFVTFSTIPPTLTPGTPTATTAALTIVGHSGSWHYKYTSPSGGTCSSGAVSGATANVAGLSPNQTYTFAAYRDSGCATLVSTAAPFRTANPALTVSNVVGDGATMNLAGWVAGTGAGKDGNWYYQADAGPHTACSSAQTSGTATLSGLTPGTAYTYTAYSDSGCTTTVAAAGAFSTLNLALSVGSVGRTSAALSLAYYSGSWHYKADAGPDSTCQGPVSGGTAESLTGLTADTAYTYKAYDKSGCADADEVESVTFTTSSLTASNLSQTDAANACNPSGDTKCAVGFTTGSAAAGYLLTGVTAKFGDATDPNDALGDLVVTLRASASNTVGDNKRPADAALATLAGDNPTTAGSHTFACAGAGCVLAANTTYFVQMAATAGASSAESYQWTATAATGQTLLPANNGWTLLDETDYHASNAWSRSAEVGKLLLSVSTQPRLEATDVTASGATLKLSLHSAAWWYQGSQAGATCTPVGANVSTATLSTLTGGTSYTYKAYDKTGCNSADEIASVTFTTYAVVTVSNLGETSNGIGIGVPPASPEAVAFTTGTNPGGYLLDSVTVKFRAPGSADAGPISAKIRAVGSDGNPAASDTYDLGSQDPTAAGDFIFDCVTSQTQTCRLEQGTTYYMVLEGTTTWSEGAQKVDTTESGNETNTPSAAGWSIAYPSKWKHYTTGNWLDEAHTVMFKVTAETR